MVVKIPDGLQPQYLYRKASLSAKKSFQIPLSGYPTKSPTGIAKPTGQELRKWADRKQRSLVITSRCYTFYQYLYEKPILIPGKSFRIQATPLAGVSRKPSIPEIRPTAVRNHPGCLSPLFPEGCPHFLLSRPFCSSLSVGRIKPIAGPVAGNIYHSRHHKLVPTCRNLSGAD